MFTIIIEVVLGQFISSLKAENHPYLFCFIKGCLLGLVGFFLAVSYNYFNDDYLMPFNDLIFFFLITQAIGVIVSVIFLLIDYLFFDKKDEIFKNNCSN